MSALHPAARVCQPQPGNGFSCHSAWIHSLSAANGYETFKGLEVEGDEGSKISGGLHGNVAQSLFDGCSKVTKSMMVAAVERKSFGKLPESLKQIQIVGE